MKQLFMLGWRNIFRNRRRTLLTTLVIGLGLAALMFHDALFIGMTHHMVARATETFMGQAQVHADGFRPIRDVEKTIHDLQGVVTRLEEHPEVSAFSLRTIGLSMVASPRNTVSLNLYGVDPSQEQHVSKLPQAITEGSFLQTDQQHSILIGDDLADLLEVTIGDRLVATVAQAHTGELSQALFRVSGIFRFGEEALDRAAAFITLPAGQKLLGVGDDVHEIAIRFHKPSTADDPIALPFQDLGGEGNEALGWKELFPSVRVILDFYLVATIVISGILFSLVLLIIINSLFMAIFERMTEFGILRAIGTRPIRLLGLIVVEAGALAILSVAVGITIDLFATGIMGVIGFDYGGVDIGGVTMAEPIYPVFHWRQVTVFPVAIFIFVIIAALYPALVAARTPPAKAMAPHE